MRSEYSSLQVVRKALNLLPNPERKKFLLLAGFRVGLHALDAMGLLLVGLLASHISGGLGSEDAKNFMSLPLISSREDLLVISFSTAGIFLLKSLMSAVVLRATTRTLGRVESAAALQVAKQIFSEDLIKFRKRDIGEIRWAVGESSQHAFSTLLYSAASVVTESTLLVVVFAVFLFVDSVATLLVAFYFLTLVAVFYFAVSKRLKNLGVSLARAVQGGTRVILALHSAFKEISSRGKSSFLLEQFRVHRNRQSEEWAKQRFSMGLPRFIIEAALMLGFAMLVGIEFLFGSQGNGLITISVFLVGGLRMMASILPLQHGLSEIRIVTAQAGLAIENLEESLLSEPGLSEPSRLELGPRINQISELRFDRVSLQIAESNLEILSEISFNLQSGDFLALLGRSGSGKTSIADLAVGLSAPTSGRVLVGDLDLRDLIETERVQIGYASRETALIPGNLAENIALQGSNELDEKRVFQLIEELELTGLAPGHEINNPDVVFKPYEGFSAGQMQRIGIARALYSEPSLLVLDEVTSSLDPSSERAVVNQISNYRANALVIAISHQPSMLRLANKVAIIEKGEIKEFGGQELLDSYNFDADVGR